MRRFISFLAGLTRFATLAVVLMLACLAPQAEALLTSSDPILSEPIPSQAHAPESYLIIEDIHPLGYADDGECLDLCICVEPETLTRVFYIVKSPTGLWAWDNYWIETFFNKSFWVGSGQTTGRLATRTVKGLGQAGLIGSDMMGYGTSSAFGWGDDYQGSSKLFKGIHEDPAAFGTPEELRDKILDGTGKAVINVGTLGAYGMIKGVDHAVKTGDYKELQDASLQAFLLSLQARSLQLKSVNPWTGAKTSPGPVSFVECFEGTPKPVLYRAIDAQYTLSTVENGFYRSGVPGRLGNDGIYASSCVEGAIAEAQYHNPGVELVVFEVIYPVEPTLYVSPPTGYFYIESPLPFSGGVNILSAPSLRLPGSMNYLIRNEAIPGGIVQ